LERKSTCVICLVIELSLLLMTVCVCFQWVPEITHHCQRTPFLLVGTQVDLRDNPATVEKLAKNRQKPISYEMGEKLARELKAVKYVECSALTQVCFVIYLFLLS